MKKLSNRILIVILLLLGAAFVASRLFNAPAKESNLRKELVKLDTARITEVRILPSSHHEQEIKLVLDGGQWGVSNGKTKSETDNALVRSMLGMFRLVEAQRMVSRKKEKWDEFNVGEKGTHIQVFENSSKLADIVVGRTGFTPSAQGGFGGGFTYLRLTNEDEVFVVEGFFESAFNRAYSDWRNKAIIRAKKEDITKITFDYPLDSGFVAEKKDSLWYVLPIGVNRTFMDNYLNRISNQNMNEFAEDYVSSGKADMAMTIDSKDKVTRVECWKQDKKWVLTSTQQKGVYFSATDDNIRNLFIGKMKLLQGDK